jgi:hypothetical protein
MNDQPLLIEIIAEGTLEYQLSVQEHEGLIRVTRRPTAASDAAEVLDASDAVQDSEVPEQPDDTADYLFEIEASEQYGHMRVVFFPDRYPAVFDLSSVQAQMLQPEPGEVQEITVSATLPEMGAPVEGVEGRDAADREGATWRIIRGETVDYLSAPSLGRVLVVRHAADQ